MNKLFLALLLISSVAVAEQPTVTYKKDRVLFQTRVYTTVTIFPIASEPMEDMKQCKRALQRSLVRAFEEIQKVDDVIRVDYSCVQTASFVTISK